MARLPHGRASGVASSSLEATPNAGTWQLLGAASSATGTNEQRPAIRSGVGTGLRVVSGGDGEQQGGAETEATIFRGQNFMTQYYGSSNPISLISHVSEVGWGVVWCAVVLMGINGISSRNCERL